MGLFNKKEFAPNIDWLIVGLGNPGTRYARTRHNCGWMSVERLADKYSLSLTRLKFKSLCAEASIGGKKCLIMKPTTYMNESGLAVVEAMNFYKIPIERVLVISDDVSLDLGRTRIRLKGSDGGQKGLRSIIYLTGKDSFPRIKVGVGAKPHPDYDMADWVLSSFTPDEMKTMSIAFDNAVSAAELIIQGKQEEAMNKYNR